MIAAYLVGREGSAWGCSTYGGCETVERRPYSGSFWTPRCGSKWLLTEVLHRLGFWAPAACLAHRCFVPRNDTQETMNGWSWRHSSSFCPFVMAGALGPADEDGSNPSSEGDNVTPANTKFAAHAPISDSSSDYEFRTQSGGDEASKHHCEPTAPTDSLPGPGVVDRDE